MRRGRSAAAAPPSARPGSGRAVTTPSAPSSRKRSSARRNARSWETATIVPSKPSSACSSASEDSMSRLSVGSSSSSRLWPSTSRQRISRRARWPPESVSQRAPRGVLQAVARERAHGALGRSDALDHDVEQRRAREVRARVELREEPGRDARPEHDASLVRDVLAGEQPHQVRLAGAVRPDQPDALAEVDLVARTARRARRSPTSWSATTRRARVAAAQPRPGSSGRRRAGAAGPSSTQRRQRVSIASAFFAQTGEYFARSLKSRTSSRSRCSSSFQRCEPVAHQLLAMLARLAGRSRRTRRGPRRRRPRA